MINLKNLLLMLLIPFCIKTVCAKTVYGRYEVVELNDLAQTQIKAKLDTGAITSSLGVKHLKLFEKGDQLWAKFNPEVDGKILPSIEKPIVRISKIKARSDDSNKQNVTHTTRPVVMMEICFDGKVEQIEVNLANRSRFDFPLLLGSNALIQLYAVVDPSKKYTIKKVCHQKMTK